MRDETQSARAHQSGDAAAARALEADTLARRRRVLGDDHPDTLVSAHNLAISLYEVGDRQAARALRQDTLERRHRVLGPGHPATLTTLEHLALNIHLLGEPEAARTLYESYEHSVQHGGEERRPGAWPVIRVAPRAWRSPGAS